MKICYILGVLLLGVLSPSLSGAVQYESDRSPAEIPRKTLCESVVPADSLPVPGSLKKSFDPAIPEASAAECSVRIPLHGQPLPGILATVLLGMALSAGWRRYAGRRRRFGEDFRDENNVSFFPHFISRERVLPGHSFCRRQKIVLRL